jgi:molecular chaperone GrpE
LEREIMSGNDRDEEKENTDIENDSEFVDTIETNAESESTAEDLYSRVKQLEQSLEEKNKECNDLHDRYLRMAADFDNYKKRVSKEKADIIAYGNEELIKALLNVLDNLERALEHSGSAEQDGPIVEGVKLVYKHFLSCLERFGVQPIEANKGQEFDPRYHQAIERVETKDVTPGIILSEMLKGYTLKDRLLRPALVVVSKEHREAFAEGASTDKEEKKKSDSGSGELLDITDEDLDDNY